MRKQIRLSVLKTMAVAAMVVVFMIPAALGSDQRGQAEDKPTSLSDARAAVEANLRTPEGKKYDEQMGAEFVQKHLEARCGNASRLRGMTSGASGSC
jgi:hypothetical protein